MGFEQTQVTRGIEAVRPGQTDYNLFITGIKGAADR